MDTKTSQTKTIEQIQDSSEKTSQIVSEPTVTKNYVPEEFFIKFDALETEIDETSFDDEIKVTFCSKNSISFKLSKIEDPFKQKNALSEKFKSATKSSRVSNRGNRRYRGNRGYQGNRGNRGGNRGNRGGNRGGYRGKRGNRGNRGNRGYQGYRGNRG